MLTARTVHQRVFTPLPSPTYIPHTLHRPRTAAEKACAGLPCCLGAHNTLQAPMSQIAMALMKQTMRRSALRCLLRMRSPRRQKAAQLTGGGCAAVVCRHAMTAQC